MWLAGWAARREPGQVVASDLHVRVLALEDARCERFVFITVDLIAVPGSLATNVAAKVWAKWGISRERLLFNASHTHTGPEIRPDKVLFFSIPPEFASKIEPYVAWLEERLVDAIDLSLRDLRPATLSVGSGKCGFAHNRRTGRYGEGASYATDHDVPVLLVEVAKSNDPSAPVRTPAERRGKNEASGEAKGGAGAQEQEREKQDGRPAIAVVFGYACHNLTLPPSFVQYCAEWVGYARDYIEQENPGTLALFLSGAGADQDPEPMGTLELAHQHGREMASAVACALAGRLHRIDGDLRVGYGETELRFEPIPSTEQLRANLKSDDAPLRVKSQYLLDALASGKAIPTTYAAPIQVLRCGDELLLIALGGEPVVQYALDFKAQFAGPMVWAAGYCNDMFGYVPTKRIYREGGYEGGRAMLWSALPAPYDETTEDRIKEAVRNLMAETISKQAI